MSSYGQLLHLVPVELRNLLRSYESCQKKAINAKWSIVFNKTCCKENFMPTYSKIKSHDPAISRSNATFKYRKYLISREISVKECTDDDD